MARLSGEILLPVLLHGDPMHASMHAVLCMVGKERGTLVLLSVANMVTLGPVWACG